MTDGDHARGPATTSTGDEPVDAVAAAVLAVPGVVDLHSGPFGEVATYLPGRRVHGISLRDDAADVHVVLAWDSSVRETAEAVRAAVSRLVATPVNITVEDLVVPPVAGDAAG